jgi:hypothetical protein
MMVLAFTFNMMVLNFSVLCFDFYTEAIVGLYILVLFLQVRLLLQVIIF